MKDTEQIYALYVQANPVPNPDLLPLTKDDAVLLSIEGSEDMQTQEPIKEQPVARNTSRNVLVAVGAFAVVIVIGLVTTLLLTSNDEPSPVAAADAAPVVVFDGSTCTYDGPTVIEEGTVEFSTTNSGDMWLNLTGWRMSGDALAEELERTPVGTDMAVTSSDPMPAGQPVLGWYILPGKSHALTWAFTEGTYLVDCVTDDRVWRPAQLEIVAP